jgi:hypothetical protein
MRATFHTFEHNNLDGMRLIRAPKYGQTRLRSWARKDRSALTLLRRRPNAMGYIFEPDGMHRLRRRASYRIALPLQAGKRSAFTLRGRALAGRKQWRFRA